MAYEYSSKAEKLEMEQRAGRLRIAKTMAEELVKQVSEKYGITLKTRIETNGMANMADWKVIFEGDNEMRVVDDWGAFPSEELRATLMLLGEMK